ncbi:oxidoreductase NAD-binding domain-containing protein 1 isoform X4 [Bubalus kerabau]|uniref:oxidoreductase NAD-binding domain-containing protein 1 isoform X4 n=1 Tax=Bubalus carabanensis TaxID=3119969 RepID=UPI00244EACC9|nr:oxidoreductase NAD-binding domain-containing protein 1 isoform X4 [Bubalus carabanensis]
MHVACLKVNNLKVVSAAKVCGVASESPSVKRLRLLVADKDFSFKAGQWVDFFIPGVSVVGGFSICSSPRLLEQERMIELAVKHANHPPALWIHNQCTLDSEVAVRVGGEFFFDPQPTDASRNLVLIAGGVGINPLLSILRHAADLLRERAGKGQGYEMGTVRLLYSAKDTSELLFKKNILDLVNEFPEKIACSLHVTKQTTQITADLRPYITGDLCIIAVTCIQRIYPPALTESVPFAINNHLNFSWFPFLEGFLTKQFSYFAEGSFESVPKTSTLPGPVW